MRSWLRRAPTPRLRRRPSTPWTNCPATKDLTSLGVSGTRGRGGIVVGCTTGLEGSLYRRARILCVKTESTCIGFCLITKFNRFAYLKDHFELVHLAQELYVTTTQPLLSFHPHFSLSTGGAPPPPPAALPPAPENYGRVDVQHEIPSSERIRELVAGYVAEHCCFGKGPIEGMKIVTVTPTPAMKVRREREGE